MAVFQTGNQQWDQGLNNLAGGLFPDPARQAQAGLYGAQTANQLLLAKKAREVLEYRQRLRNEYHLDQLGNPTQGQPPVGDAPALSTTVAPGPAPAPPPMATGAPVAPAPAPAMSLSGTVAPGAPAPLMPPGAPVATTAPAAAPPAPPGAPRTATGAPDLSRFTPGQLTAMSLLADLGSDSQILSRADINTRIDMGAGRPGGMAPEQGTRWLSGYGDTGPLTAQTNIKTHAMDNATTLEGHRIVGANQLANTTALGRNAIELKNRDPQIVVDPNDPKRTPIVRSLGDTVAPGATYEHYDSAREIPGDKPAVVAGGTDPTKDPTIVQTRDLPGRTPYNETRADTMAKNINVVDLATGDVSSHTEAELTANAGKWRRATPEDEKLVQVTQGGRAIWVPASKAAVMQGTATPTGTDQLIAQSQSGISEAIRTGDTPMADIAARGLRTAQTAAAPRTAMSVPDLQRAQMIDDQHFQSKFPPPSGIHAWASTKKVGPDPALKVYHDQLTEYLRANDYNYKINPGAAGQRAWDMMFEPGSGANGQPILSPTLDRSVGVSPTGSYADIVGNPKDQHFVVHGNLPKDAQGNVIWPGQRTGAPLQPGPRVPAAPASELVQTVAAASVGAGTGASTTSASPQVGTVVQSAPATGPLPTGAIGVAPPGLVEGTVLQQKDGRTAVVKQGYLYIQAPLARRVAESGAKAIKSFTGLADPVQPPPSQAPARPRPPNAARSLADSVANALSLTPNPRPPPKPVRSTSERYVQ